MALLEVAALSKSFGGLQAVRNLTFTVGERDVVALIGPNGAGKTTVFGLVSGFLAPDAGRIVFRGRSIVGLPPHRVAALGLARTFQIVRPFPRLSVLRNVMVGALARHPHPRQATVHAAAVLDEVGLTAKREQPAGALTLAERKRLELARALATEPALLLLDEVMAGLNAAEVERTVDLIRAINRRGIAILLIEHVMRAVMSLAERIVVLNYGERIAEGRPDEVASDPRVIEAYLGEADATEPATAEAAGDARHPASRSSGAERLSVPAGGPSGAAGGRAGAGGGHGGAAGERPAGDAGASRAAGGPSGAAGGPSGAAGGPSGAAGGPSGAAGGPSGAGG